jgi:hypothetical protein
MNLNLLIAVTIFATPIAQMDDRADHALIVQDAQKVVQAISNDNAKLQAYCELGKLEDQMAKAEEREDTKTVETLFAKVDTLAHQIGPEYLSIVNELEEVDPKSTEGQKLAAIFNTLHDKCK